MREPSVSPLEAEEARAGRDRAGKKDVSGRATTPPGWGGFWRVQGGSGRPRGLDGEDFAEGHLFEGEVTSALGESSAKAASASSTSQ